MGFICKFLVFSQDGKLKILCISTSEKKCTISSWVEISRIKYIVGDYAVFMSGRLQYPDSSQITKKN